MFYLQLIAILILVHFFAKLYPLLGKEKTRREVILEAYLDIEAKMLGIFKNNLVNPPKELNSPASLNSSTKSKLPDEILQYFVSCNPSRAFSMSFGNDALLAYSPSNKPFIHNGYVPLGISEFGLGTLL